MRPVASFDVRYVRGSDGGPWTMWSTGLHETHAQVDLHPGLPGDRYRIQVRARDVDGVLSDWSEAPFSLPLDEDSLVAGPGWKRVSSDDYYRSSALRATKQGAALRFKDLGTVAVMLVATTCPTCGTVQVSVVRSGSGEEEDDISPPEPVTVSLQSSRRRDRQLIFVMADDENLYGELVIEVLSQGRPVIIDGLLLADYE